MFLKLRFWNFILEFQLLKINKMNNKVLLECIKSFSIGAIIGLIFMYFRKTDSFLMPVIFGFITLSIHARNNTYIKNK
jgi:hypothetical protein